MDNMSESNPTNIEILRLAKELAYSDYNNRKADLHNQWLAEDDFMWRTQRMKVAYPPIPKFPTEEEIARRAERLLEFLRTPRPDLEEQKAIKEVKTLIQEVNNEPVIDEPQITITENTLDVGEPTVQLSESMIDKIKKAWR